MEVKTPKETAQEMVKNDIIDGLKFHLDFYAKELGEQLVKGNTHMVEHCEQMYRAYKQVYDVFTHFKFT